MKNLLRLVFIVALFMYCQFICAQNTDTLYIRRNEKGIIQCALFKPDENSDRKMQNDTLFLKSILRAKKEDSFHIIKIYHDNLGLTHKRFQQYYKGLKVENAEYLVHGKNGYINDINGDFQIINISDINPSLAEQKALTIALAFINAKKYTWEDAGMEKLVKQNTNNLGATFYPKGELVISKDYLNGNDDYKLSWKFTISSLQPYNSQLIYVDANNGEILNNGSLIYNSNISCTADTKYSGTKNLTGDLYSGPWIRLQEVRDGVSIHTKNLNDGNDFDNASEFQNSNTSWTNGSWNTFAQDQWALDAHWNAEMVLDFWNTVFQRNSLDDRGHQLSSFVHFSHNIGYNEAYAGWDDDTLKLWAMFGDGDNSRKPFTSLDLCGHEFGHGITQFTSRLIEVNSTEESAALNEGFSDIWGACVEHWAAPNKQTWLMGEDLFDPGTINCVRSLQDPNSTSNWESHDPDTYHGLYWDYNGEPHHNSTVLSHWFYLLSQGGSGTNDIQHSYEVYGIDIDVAQKIAYEGEKRLQPTSDFAAAQEQAINAATSIFSVNSLEVMQVQNAWYAVGIGSQPTQMTISGSSLVCSSGTTFTISNVPWGCTVAWNQSSNLTLSSASGNSATFAAVSGANSEGWIQAIVHSSVSGTTATGPHHIVWAGTPALTSIAGPSPPVGYTGTQLTFWTDPSRDSQPLSQAEYEWQVQPSYYNYYFNYQYYDWATITFYDPYEYYQVMARATNTCGPSNWKNKIIGIYSDYLFSISPNPASEEVKVTVLGTNSSAIATDNKVPEFNIQICDLYGKIYYTEKKTGLFFTMPVSNLKDGSYLISFNYDKKKKSLPLIIKH